MPDFFVEWPDYNRYRYSGSRDDLLGFLSVMHKQITKELVRLANETES